MLCHPQLFKLIGIKLAERILAERRLAVRNVSRVSVTSGSERDTSPGQLSTLRLGLLLGCSPLAEYSSPACSPPASASPLSRSFAL